VYADELKFIALICFTDTFSVSYGTLVADYGAITFFSNIFANTANSGEDAVLRLSGVFSNWGYNIYVAYSGVSPGTNDLGQ